MTKGSSDTPQGGSGKKPTKDSGRKDDAAQTGSGKADGKQPRKAAKTMLETSIPDFVAEEPTAKSGRKAPKTMLEGISQQAEPAKPAEQPKKGTQEQSETAPEPARKGTVENVPTKDADSSSPSAVPRRVAKTMMERPVVDMATLKLPDSPVADQQQSAVHIKESENTPTEPEQAVAESAGAAAEPAAETQSSAAPEARPDASTGGVDRPKRNRDVSRTMLENPVSSFDRFMQGEDVQGEMVEEPLTAPAAEPPPQEPPAQIISPRPADPTEGGKGARRVAKTMIEQPMGNFEKYMPAAEPARTEPQAPSAADIARIDSVEIPVQKVPEMKPEPSIPTPADIARIDSVEIPVQKAPPKSGVPSETIRRPKRTLMENEIPHFVLEKLHEEPAPAPDAKKEKMKSPRRVYKTLMDNEIADFESEVLANVQPMEGLTTDAPPVQEPRKFVARTMLDMNLLSAAVAKHEKKMEEKAVEVAKQKALEPQKPFIKIDNYKLAMSCPYRWDGSVPKERYRACGKCNTWLYDFEGLELPEAEALVYKCQNMKDPSLYKREDGKFMTTDCQEALKKKQNNMTLMVGAILAIIAIAAVIMMIPKPPPPPPAPPPTADTTTTTTTSKKKHGRLVPVKAKDGSVHFERSKDDSADDSGSPSSGSSTSGSSTQPAQQDQGYKPIPMVAPSSPQSSGSQQSSDQVWQYSNPNDSQVQTQGH